MCSPARIFTVAAPRLAEVDTLAVDPAGDRDEIRDKAGNVTADQDVIADSDVLVQGGHAVALLHRWKNNKPDLDLETWGGEKIYQMVRFLSFLKYYHLAHFESQQNRT